MRRYEGKEPCLGCQRAGEEAPRSSKNSLCYDCGRHVDLGKRYDEWENKKCLRIGEARIKWYYFDYFLNNFDMGKTIDESNKFSQRGREFGRSITRFLKEISFIRTTKGVEREENLRITEATMGNEAYLLPVAAIREMKSMIDQLKDVCDIIKADEVKLEKDKVKEIQRVRNEERDRIFNEGVDKGRNLLLQLNAGKITLDSFEKAVFNYNN